MLLDTWERHRRTDSLMGRIKVQLMVLNLSDRLRNGRSGVISSSGSPASGAEKGMKVTGTGNGFGLQGNFDDIKDIPAGRLL